MNSKLYSQFILFKLPLIPPTTNIYFVFVPLLLRSADDQIVDEGFHTDVENGSMPSDGRCNTRKGITTRVVLVCNLTAQWTNQNLTGLIKVVLSEEF